MCMKNVVRIVVGLVAGISFSTTSHADSDGRVLVQLPERMQQHMMSNMRDHLLAVNEILLHLGQGNSDAAAEIAEKRLGMSALQLHGADHMGRFMPKGMQKSGSAMHRAASRFARKAEEGDLLAAYRSLSEITSACVNCHAAYRIR